MSGNAPDYTIDVIIPLRPGDCVMAKTHISPVSTTVFVMDLNIQLYMSWPQCGNGHAIVCVNDVVLRKRIEEEIIDRSVAR